MKKIQNKEKNNSFRTYLLIFLLSFIPKIIVNLFVITTPGGHDDLGMLIVPSIVAGYRWKGLIPDTGYYGFGYSILYTPFLMLFKENSYLMFQAIFALNAAIQSMMSLIIYKLLREHYKVCSDLQSICISVLMSYMLFVASCKIENDVILPCVTFVFVWILTLLLECKNKSKKSRLTVALVGVMGYSLTLHSRSIIYWIGIIGTIVLCKIFFEKWIVDMRIFVIGSSVLYYTISMLISRIQNQIWESTEVLTNSTGVIGNMLQLGINSIFSENSFKVLFTLVCSNLFAIIQYTNGFFLLGILGIGMFVVKIIKHRGIEKIPINERKVLLGSIFSVLCFCMMFGGLCISYLYPALDAYEKNSSYSGFFYIRYYYNFGFPIVMLGILVCIYVFKRMEYKKIIANAVFLFTVCYFVVVTSLKKLPLRDYWTSFGMKFGGNDQSILDMKSYKLIYVGTLLVMLLFLYLLKRKKDLAFIFILLVCIYNYSYQNINSARNWAENYYSKTNSFEKIINEFKLDSEEYYICVDYSSAAYGLQLRKMDCVVYNDLTQNEGEKIVFLRNYRSEDLIVEGYEELKISEDEFLYINDIETYKMIKGGKL